MGDDINFKTKYLMYKAKYLSLKNNSNQKGGGDDVEFDKNNTLEVLLFKSNMCGHCVSFVPTWEKLQNKYKSNKRYNFITYDAQKNSEKLDEYGIEGIPTIYLQQDNKKLMHEGKRDMETLSKLLDDN